MPVPNKAMRQAAERGLRERQKYIDAGVQPPATPVGVKRANDIANGANLSLSTVKRMKSFLERHQQNYKPGEKVNVGRGDKQKSTLTKGTISYLLWGGAPALRWVNAILRDSE